MELQKRTNLLTGEVLFSGRHESGLDIYIMPRKGYKNNYAIFGTKYGSVDSEFIVPGDTSATKVPDGIAHYLEHKMFDQPDGTNIFDRFAKYGANANAFTSFNMTAYLFSATEHIHENLKTLLTYVQTPYFTSESVQKEQGIIGQEIRMYDDQAGWKVFFNFLECLYQNHPVKLDIAGTIESISKIDSPLLYKCYNTFYNLSNMAVFVTGDFDENKVLETIEANILNSKPFDSEIQRIYPNEPAEIAAPYKEQNLSVANPLFTMGFKDTDVGYSGNKLLKKDIEMSILLEMLLGKSSPVYKKLYEDGLINSSFGTEFDMQPDYAFSLFSGESKNPHKVRDIILEEISSLHSSGLSEEDFNRIKKVIWGDYIRSYNNIDGYAHKFISLNFMNINYFDYYDVYQTVTFSDICERFKNHFDESRCALSVINPV